MKIFELPLLRVLPLMLGRRMPVLMREETPREAIWLVVLLMLAWETFADWWMAEPARYWSNWGFTPFFADLTLMWIFCYLLTRFSWNKQPLCKQPPWLVLGLFLEVILVFSPFSTAVEWYTQKNIDVKNMQIVGVGFLLWVVLVIFMLLRQFMEDQKILASAFLVLFAGVVIAPSMFLDYSNYKFWYHDSSAEMAAEKKNRIQDYEHVFFSQDSLVNMATGQLTPETTGVVDLFYLGFGSYASQAVFKREVEFLQYLAEKEQSGKKRSVILINHRDTVEKVPLAIHHNLRTALHGMSQHMNPEEDIIFLYLTSHGSKNHTLSISFYPFEFVDLTPAMLKSALDDAGLRWRVLVVSACYAGGFIEPLKNDNTIIVTAADANNTSFGCADENNFTYFGEAILRDQLLKGVPMLDAFPRAIDAIKAREVREKKDHSNPQLWIGQAIAAQIQLYEQQKTMVQEISAAEEVMIE